MDVNYCAAASDIVMHLVAALDYQQLLVVHLPAECFVLKHGARALVHGLVICAAVDNKALS